MASSHDSRLVWHRKVFDKKVMDEFVYQSPADTVLEEVTDLWA